MTVLRALFGLVLVASLAGAAAIGAGWWLWRQPGPLAATAVIVVPRGSVSEVATTLRDAGAISGRVPFEALALATRGAGALRAAEFAFPAHASIGAVLAVLREGRPVQHRLTIAEGLSASEIATLLAAADGLAGPLAVPPEGAVLPQTYSYERGFTRAAMLRRMERAMQGALSVAWQGRDPAIALRSPRDMLTLASIVERETGIASERPMVAAVFLNRLRLGMRLQSDPTVAYAVTGGLGVMDRPLSRADLAVASPYNTYAVAGLPPGPICSPGEAAIDAVAHPAATDALYFVATGTGGHAFAATLGEHARNVARLRALEASH